MKWNEFYSLLAGLSAESPLGRIVQIRTETDKNILKNFTTSQKRIRSEYQRRKAKYKQVTNEDTEQFYRSMEQFFKNM